MAWVAEINGYDPSLPGASSRIFAMGPGVAFSDHAYAPSGFFSWKSANQKVDVGPGANRTISNISLPVTSAAGVITLTSDNGQLVIQNLPNDIAQAGPLDALIAWSFDMRRANLYWIGDNTWANRQLVDTAIMQQPFATLVANGSVNSTLVFQLRDPRISLSVPLQPTKYLGTNSGGSGVEGEADIKGNPKPVLYGVASNIPPIRVNASQLIYQVADRPAAILCVRDGGLALAAGVVRASLATLQSNSPAPGSYDVYSGPEGTFFKLGTTPVFQVACDAQEGVGRVNLLLQSSALDITWTKTGCTITANSTTAPDGTATADTVTRTTTGASNYSQAVTLPGVAATYTRSVRVKLSSGNFYAMAAIASGGRADVCFNINTGGISLPAAVTGDFPAASASIASLGGGYWLCSLTFTTGGETTCTLYGSTTSVSQAVDGTGSANSTAVIVWGESLAAGFVPRDLIQTTTAQVTASRTNLFVSSAALDAAAWTKTGATVTADGATAPDGTQTADILVRTTTGASFAQQAVTKAAATVPYAVSAYGSLISGNFLAARLDDGAGNHADVCFNLSTGVVSLAPSVTGTFANASAGIAHQVNGLYYVWLIATSSAAVTIKGTLSGSSVSQQVDGTGSANSTQVALWGMQLEQASAPTQYIATGAAAGTGADMSQRTHAQIWARMRTERCGTLVSSLNATALAAADALDGNEVGFWFGGEVTQLDAMNQLLTSFSGYEVEGFDFSWSFGKVIAPAGTTVLDFCIVSPTSTLTGKNRALRNMQSVRPGFAPNGAPPYRVTVNWGQAYLQMSEADFAGAAPQRLRDKFGLQYRSETRLNTAIWNPATKSGPWLSATELVVNTGYQPGDDGLTSFQAGAEAQRLLDLYSLNKNAYQIDFTPKVTDQITVGQVVSLAYPQFGLSGGPLFLVIQTMLTVESELATMALVLGFQT